MENMKEIEFIEEPYADFLLDSRDHVRYQRARSAFYLARRMESGAPSGRVSRKGYDRAAKLLDRIQRFALAHVRQFLKVNTSETYAKSEERVKVDKRLERRFVELDKELSAYGFFLRFLGLSPSIENRDGDHFNFLHFYD